MRIEKWQCHSSRTLVTCRNMTNGRFDLVAVSCSTPMTMPLSMRTATEIQSVSKCKNNAFGTYIVGRNQEVY